MNRRDFLAGIGSALSVALAGCAGELPDPETQQPADATETPEPTETEPPMPKLAVRIAYSGSWRGVVGTAQGQRSVDGSGEAIYKLDPGARIVSANAQKQDDSSRKLTIQILKKGRVVAEQSTTAAYGVAQVSSQV